MNKAYLITSVFLLLGGLLQAQSFQGEEAKVVEAVKKDIKLFYERDYEKWAEMWVHEPYIRSTAVGPDGYNGMFGWQDISAWSREFMNSNPSPVAIQEIPLEDLEVLLRGDLAIVRFHFEGASQTRILEKHGGQWKLVGVERINTNAFETKRAVEGMKGLTGEWQLDPGSPKVRNSNWALKGANCQVESTPSGIRVHLNYELKNPVGDLVQGTEEIQLALNSGNQQMAGSRIWHWPGSGFNYVSYGKGEMHADGAISLHSEIVGDENNTLKQILKPTGDGKLEMRNVFYPGQDREWEMSYVLVKKDSR